MSSVSRRNFLLSSTAAAVAVPTVATFGADQTAMPESFPTHDPEIVREVVAKAHFDLEGVRKLVSARPMLAKAGWDWGFGDWESALGAASHMGNREMAELLISHGARPTIFTFAMLGQVDVIRSICQANPGIQRTLGPHGFTLMQHARHGGEEAKLVVEYLNELGDADVKPASLPLDEAAAAPYIGSYTPLGHPETVFVIAFNKRNDTLTFQRDERQVRFLVHEGPHTFSASGGQTVQIAFDVRNQRAENLVIRDGDLVIAANRKG